jgi:DNA repair protein RecO (recombination protein O)
VHSAQATLIRLVKLGDTSWIVHWSTQEHGLIRTVAKAARRPSSPFAGRLDLFHAVDMVFQRARRGDLHTLREVSVIHRRDGLRRGYPSLLLAGYCCRLFESAVEPEHPDPILHDLLNRALDHLATEGPSLRAMHHFERELARLLGIAQDGVPAEASMRRHLGRLPESRDELSAMLAAHADLDSSTARSSVMVSSEPNLNSRWTPRPPP